MKIAIIGAGAFGTALGKILENKGHVIDYYDLKIKNKLSDVINGADYLLLTVPSTALNNLLLKLPKKLPLIVATKGLLSDDVFKSFDDYMIISGPGFANDINNQKETFLTITDKRLQNLFKTDFLFFDYTKDKKGVLLCGALKNIYAILAGYLNLTPLTDAWRDYIDSVTNEMYKILKQNGANASTFNLACGRGDLELTCDLPSRNYDFGLKIAQTPNFKPQKTIEGLSTLSLIRQGGLFIPKDAILLKKIIELSEDWNLNATQ